MELSTYFRINAAKTGQFERTLIIADEGAYVSYLEGCTAPMRDENQLHAAVVELVALDDAPRSSTRTVQNWYPGDEGWEGRHLQLRDQAGALRGEALARSPGPRSRPARPSPGSTRASSSRATTPSGEFYSVAVTNHHQQADTGTKMIHLGKQHHEHHRLEGDLRGPRRPVLPGPRQDRKERRQRPELPSATRSCWGRAAAPTPSRTSRSRTGPRRSSTRPRPRKISDDQLFYCLQRGISEEDAVSLIVNGFCKDVFKRAPHGVRGRSPEAPRDQPRGRRRLSRPLHIPLEETAECSSSQGPPRRRGENRSSRASTSTDQRRARSTPSWGPTARASRTLASVLAGRDGYEVTEGSVTFDGQDLLALWPEERRRAGVFLAFQYPIEIPGRREQLLPARLGAQRPPQGQGARGDRQLRLPRPGQGQDGAA
jgi:hypothetical protein